MDFHTEYLGKPFVPTWIYGDVDPHNEEFNQTIQAVERALGFKLFVWQLRRIKCKLDEAGIPTRLVWFSERDKHYWLHR